MNDAVPDLQRRVVAEAIGTGMLVAVVVGSGAAASRMTSDVAVVLLANAFATAAALAAIILAFGHISGAHLNPMVTLAERAFGRITGRAATAYIGAQLAGGAVGAVVANVMFDLAPLTVATQSRGSGGVWVGEVVATFGLVTIIAVLVSSPNRSAIPYAVAGYIAAAYWFTSSTSFANPAVTVARTLTDTFTGIAPSSVPAFLAAQAMGTGLAVALVRFLTSSRTPDPVESVPSTSCASPERHPSHVDSERKT